MMPGDLIKISYKHCPIQIIFKYECDVDRYYISNCIHDVVYSSDILFIIARRKKNIFVMNRNSFIGWTTSDRYMIC
jgi:hypothetical protein